MKFITSLSLSFVLSFASYAQTATMTAPVTATTAVPTVQKEVKKSVKKEKKAHLSPKARAKASCLKGNPSLRTHKKRLNRCIKRKLHGF